MRVITGSARGHALKAPKGQNTRPTSDKVKGAIFNIIGYIDEEDVILDLFSGSGSIGIEFLSRGAKACHFVDEDVNSIKVIKDNLDKTRLSEKSLVYKNNVGKTIKILGSKNLKFDYIFLDPPYNKDYVMKTLVDISRENLLNNLGKVIIEHESKLELLDKYENLIKIDYRKYGDTSISFYKKEEE